MQKCADLVLNVRRAMDQGNRTVQRRHSGTGKGLEGLQAINEIVDASFDC